MKRLGKVLVAVVAAVAFAGVAAPVSAEHDGQGLEEHCPDHNGHPGKVNDNESPKTITVDGVEVKVVISGKTVQFFDSDDNPIEVEFCIKAADLAGGVETGSSGEVWWKNHGGQIPDISHVVVYKVVDEEPPDNGEPPENGEEEEEEEEHEEEEEVKDEEPEPAVAVVVEPVFTG